MDVTDMIGMLESSDLEASRAVKELVLDNLRANKDAWLVNALVDSYICTKAPRCLEIIALVVEPHDKHVFDRLCAHLKGQHKLVTLNILATLVYKQPSWIQKIVSHQLLQVLIKCLKSDNDIPVLLSGLLIITALLPVVPVTIKDHLPMLFEVFLRLAGLCLNPPSQAPELYLYHLNVGIYCLHHRLYGMYPYHFLTFVRNACAKQENSKVFEQVIRPMIDKVRLHPLLFSTNREKEVSRERWRLKEAHDVLVECSQYSLDLTEGITREFTFPAPQRIPELTRCTPKAFQHLTELMTPNPGSLLANLDATSVMTSGLQGSMIMTPPPSQGSQPPTPGSQVQGQESPLPDEKGQKPKKRLSQSGLTLFSKLPSSAEGTPLYPDSCSVPPSPLRPDFSEEFSHHAPVSMLSTRKLSFQQSEAAFQADLGRTLEKILVEKSTRTTDMLPPASELTADTRLESSAQLLDPTVIAMPPGAKSSTETVDTDVPLSPNQGESLFPADTNAPSLAQLNKIFENLDPQPEADTDNEVSELTADGVNTDEILDLYPDDYQSQSLPTAAYMTVLMKKVKRIRFNSINVHSDNTEKMTRIVRPRSCPTLHMDDRSITTEVSHDADSLASGTSFSIESPTVSLSLDEKHVEKRSNSSQTSLYALSAQLLKKGDRVASVRLLDNIATETDDLDLDLPLDNFPYKELFGMALPFSPFIQCYSCARSQTIQSEGIAPLQKMKNTQPVFDDVKPLFSTCSPVELLDCLLNKSASCHHHMASSVIPGTHTVNADLMSCSDVNILRDQIEMLRHQLLYERHKRELHAQRNRRLLSRTVKTTALQEHNIAMMDQLQLQEQELVSLRKTLQQQQQQCQQLEITRAAHEPELEKTLRTYRTELEVTQGHNRELEAQLQTVINEKKKAFHELQGYQAQVFRLNQEVTALKEQTNHTKQLREQVAHLNKELLLMGELQEKYQSRLVAHTQSENSNIHTHFLIETYKNELNNTKQNLSQKIVAQDALNQKLSAKELELKKKDLAIQELKQMIETARDTYGQEMKAVEEKYESLKKSHVALQTEFMNVYEQIGRSEARALRLSRQMAAQAPHSYPAVEAAVGAEGSSECNLPLLISCSHLPEAALNPELPEALRAPASESSIESAEEAFPADTSSQ